MLQRTTSDGSRYAGFSIPYWRIGSELKLGSFDLRLLPEWLTDEVLRGVSRHTGVVMDSLSPATFSTLGLPDEFCIRELMELDVNNDDALLAFIERYGLVVSPWLESKATMQTYHANPRTTQSWERFGEAGLEEHLLVLWQRVIEERTAVKGSDGYRSALGEAAWLSEAMRASQLLSEGKVTILASWEEVTLSLRLLKESVALLAALDLAGGDLLKACQAMVCMGATPFWLLGGRAVGEWSDRGWHWLKSLSFDKRQDVLGDMAVSLLAWKALENAEIYLNGQLSAGLLIYGGFRTYRPAHGSEYGLILGEAATVAAYPAESALMRYSNELGEGSLPSAIALDLIAMVQSSIPWKQCRNPRCERWFKHSRKTILPSVRVRERDAAYCSDACRKGHRRLQESEASAELEKRIRAHWEFIKHRSREEQVAWLMGAVAELNVDSRYLSAYDAKRYREMGGDTAWKPSRPVLKTKHVDKAVRLLRRLAEVDDRTDS